MIEVLLLEHHSADAEFIIEILQQINSDVHVEWVRHSSLITDFIFCTGVYAPRDPQRLPRVIVLDMTDPSVSLELLRTIKAYARTRVIPVVILIDDQDDPVDFRGADLCIVKTADRQKFTHAVRLMAQYWLSNRPIGLSLVEQLEDNQAYTASFMDSDLDPSIH